MTERKHRGQRFSKGWLWQAISLLLIVVLVVAASAAGDDQISLAQEPEGAAAETGETSGGNPKLDSSLNQLLLAYDRAGIEGAEVFSATSAVELEAGRVTVSIRAEPDSAEGLGEAISDLGGEIQSHYGGRTVAFVPIDALEPLAEREDVALIALPRQPILLDTDLVGRYTSEGVAASNASAWHTAGQRGTGVRIAVIDAGFDGYSSLLGSDLPASVQTYDWTNQGIGGSPHGTACAEIAYDMAPGATIYLHKVSYTTHVGQAVDQAIADGVNVITMSLGWTIDGPGDGTGFLADIVKKARQNGIFYATAAGNEADETWHGTYQDDGSGRHRWPSGDWVNEFTSYINAGEVIRVGLHWDDWTNTGQDYDLELYRKTGSTWVFVTRSDNRQSGGYPTPEEWIGMYAPVSGRYGIVVSRHSATRNVCFRVLAPKMDALEDYTTQRNLTFPADSTDAITAGALDVNSPYPLESYSSHGPNFGPGGVCSGGTVKPDLGGYANVSTVSYGPTYFNGTSSATPHVAGAAALVKGANPGYTPGQIQSFLEQRAVDQGPGGKDNEYGAGRLYLGTPPGGGNTPPSISGLPDQSLSMNTSKPQAIDLWAYASDAESANSELTYTIDNSPNSSAGVSIQSNRYVSIQPATGWTGQTNVTIRVTDPGSLSATDAFQVTVTGTGGGKVWNGSSSNDWHTASNWSPSGVPAMTDDVTIPDVTRDPVISSGDAAAKNLTVERGAVLDLGTRELTVEGTVFNSGTLKQTQSVTGGGTTPFLRITNLARNQTKYYGVDITPTGSTSATNGDARVLAVAPRSPAMESPVASAPGQHTLIATGDATVLQGYSFRNFGGVWSAPPQLPGAMGTMWAGYDDYLIPPAEGARSLIKFDLDGLPAGQEVTKATLRIYLVLSYDYPGARVTVTTHRLTGAWSESDVTWNNKPGYKDAYGTQSIEHAVWGWYEFDVTELVKAWHDGTSKNHGILLQGPEDEFDARFRAFATREEDSQPQLVVELGSSGNTPPAISGLPDKTVPKNGSMDRAIDLHQYASDAEDSKSDLNFTISNSPDASAGVSIDANRYIDIYPVSGWTGSTQVEVQVEDTGGLTDTDRFRVTVTDEDSTSVTVAIAGDQQCAGRATGVKRCYDIESSGALEALVRFYFRGAEQGGKALEDLKAYHFDGDWQEEPGPYTRGVEDPSDGLYVQAQNVDSFSLFALDTQAEGISAIYLPLVSRQEPQVPAKPVLGPISNPDGDGTYTVAWQAVAGATGYRLQEDDTMFFSSPATRYSGPATSWISSGIGPGTYYYRVEAIGGSGSSGWSNVAMVQVTAQPPQAKFYAIADAGIYQGAPGQNFGSYADMWAGYGLAACGVPQDYETSRSLLAFDLSSIPSGTAIDSASLHLRIYGLCYRQPTTPRTATTYRVADNWSESSVTWNSQPALAEAHGSVPIPFEAGTWHSFDVTNLVRSWVDGSQPNHGIAVRGPEGTGSNLAWIGFFSSETDSSPYLDITYTGVAVSATDGGEAAAQSVPGSPHLGSGCAPDGSGDVLVACPGD